MDLIKKLSAILMLVSLYAANMYASNNKLLFNGNCIICHLTNKTKTAPSIIKIKNHYLTAFPAKKDFVNQMSIWVKNPKEETSIMYSSIQKFKLMPNLAYDIETLEAIATYIYETNFLINEN